MAHDASFTVYVLRTSGNTLYIGQTNDLGKRMSEHKAKSKRSSKYMRSFESFTLVHTERYPTKSEALKREWELKKLSHKEKESLIQGSRLISGMSNGSSKSSNPGPVPGKPPPNI